MNSNNKSNQKLYTIIGYGTFITRGHWKDKKNVVVCLVEGYARVFPKGNWYPYVIKAENSSFWALKFDVDENQLENLDYYEGVPSNLYERVEIEVLLRENTKSIAYIYVPTKDTIKTQNISIEQDKTDRWKEEIKKHPEIIEKFPELV